MLKRKRSEVVAVGLTNLPPELLEVVGAHVGPGDLVRLAMTCRALRDLFAHPDLWRRLCWSRWPSRAAAAAPHGGGPRHVDWRRVCLREWAVDEWRSAADGRWRQRRLEGHTGSVQAIQLLPRYVVSGALDGRVKVWERESGQCRYTFAKHKGPVTCLRYDGGTHLMASGSVDGTIQLYNLAGGVVNALKHDGKVLALQLHGDVLYSGGSTGVIYERSVSKQRIVSTLGGHDQGVACLAHEWEYRMLASGGADGMVKLWDLRMSPASPTGILKAHPHVVSSVSLSGDVLVTSSRSCPKLHVWDLRKLMQNEAKQTALLATMQPENAGVVQCSHYDGVKLLSSAERESCVRLWDPRDWTCKAKWPHSAPTLCLDAPSNRTFVAGNRDYTIHLWEKRHRGTLRQRTLHNTSRRTLQATSRSHRSHHKRKRSTDDSL